MAWEFVLFVPIEVAQKEYLNRDLKMILEIFDDIFVRHGGNDEGWILDVCG